CVKLKEHKHSCHSLEDVVPQRSFLDDEIILTDIARRYDGKLLLEVEYDLPCEIFSKLVAHQILSPVIPIRKSFLMTKCMRCQNDQKHLFGMINCACCKK